MDFFSFFKSKKNTKSKEQAKQRLQLVLLHDRGDSSSTEFLDKLKGELLDVIKKYIEIDESEFDISLTKTKSEDGSALVPALVANIPFNKIKQ